MQSPSGGWDSGVSVAVSSLGYSTGASVVTSTLAASASAYTYASDPSSAYYTYASDPSSTASYASGADPSGTAAIKAAGNLAETDDEDLNNQVDYYKNKVRISLLYIPACMLGVHMLSLQAKTYEIVTFALAGALGLGIIAAIVAVVMARRNKASARPSAYRSIHEAESSEPKAALYDAEGGHSRYSDPYHDATQ